MAKGKNNSQATSATVTRDANSQRLIDQSNLQVLRRSDPAIERLLASSAHVAVYHFSQGANKWDRSNVEGTLFIVQRNTEPRFQLIIMNKLDAENVVEPLTRAAKLQVDDANELLLLMTERREVKGFWVYNKEERARLGQLVQGIVAGRVPAPPAAASPPSPSPSPSSAPLPSPTPVTSTAQAQAQANGGRALLQMLQGGGVGGVGGGRGGGGGAPVQRQMQQAAGQMQGANGGGRGGGGGGGGMVQLPPGAVAHRPAMQQTPPSAPAPVSAPPSVSPHVAVQSRASAPSGGSVPVREVAGSVPRAAAPPSAPTVTLTRDQLKQALVSLVNDDIFVDFVFREISRQQ